MSFSVSQSTVSRVKAQVMDAIDIVLDGPLSMLSTVAANAVMLVDGTDVITGNKRQTGRADYILTSESVKEWQQSPRYLNHDTAKQSPTNSSSTTNTSRSEIP